MKNLKTLALEAREELANLIEEVSHMRPSEQDCFIDDITFLRNRIAAIERLMDDEEWLEYKDLCATRP